MKNSTFLFFLVPVLLLFTSCAPTYQRLVAYDQVEAMRNGVLLVPLSPDTERAERLERYGLERRAKRVRKRSEKQCHQLMEAFASEFTFCPVYFCLAQDLSLILDEGQTGLYIDKSLTYNTDLFVDPAENAFFLGGIESVWQSQGDNDKEVEMFIIRDVWGNALTRPFPDAVEIGQNVSASRLRSSIRTLNTNLGRFYEQRQNYMERQRTGRYFSFTR